MKLHPYTTTTNDTYRRASHLAFSFAFALAFGPPLLTSCTTAALLPLRLLHIVAA